jgi:hypothetical protein
MRQLDTCDFCDDAAEGVYEVVPAAVAGEPRRLALCASCRETLRSVVDPLLDAAGDDAREASDAPAAPNSPGDGLSDGTDAASAGTATSGGPDSEGVTIEVGGGEGDGGDETAHGDGPGDGSGAADGDAGDDAAAGGAPAARPDGYAQVIRLLQNRDGAMPREDLRALATNAYDLTSRQFEAALDAAVHDGDVEETADGLRTA